MHKVLKFRKTAQDILSGLSPLKALIIGPCSIHNIEETFEYAVKLKELEFLVKDRIFIVLRVFLEKPRTANSWRGFLHDPDLNGSLDLEKGIKLSKKLLDGLLQLELPLATEFIDPCLAQLLERFITWGFIGARTTRSPTHRQLAAFLKMPIGFKNPLDGDLHALTQAIDVAKAPHQALCTNSDLCLEIKKTQGNPFCHSVLRGSFQGPNYHMAKHLHDPLIIDCAHGNSGKTLNGMIEAFTNSSHLAASYPHIKGLMPESFLNAGKQTVIGDKGLSLTDPCLSFAETKSLVLDFYKLLSQSQGSSSALMESSFRSTSSETLISLV